MGTACASFAARRLIVIEEPHGAIMVIARDSRGGIRKLLAADKSEQAKIADETLGDVKIDVVRRLAAQASSVPLDAVCAVPRVVDEGAPTPSRAKTGRWYVLRQTSYRCPGRRLTFIQPGLESRLELHIHPVGRSKRGLGHDGRAMRASSCHRPQRSDSTRRGCGHLLPTAHE